MLTDFFFCALQPTLFTYGSVFVTHNIALLIV